MRAAFEATKPDDIEFSMTLTMSLKEWRQLRERINEEWPGWDLRRHITDMVNSAEKQFYARTE